MTSPLSTNEAPAPKRRPGVRTAIAVGSVLALAAAGVTAGVVSANTPPTRGTESAVQSHLDELVATNGFPGALAAVTDADGRVTDYTAGVGNLETGDPVPADGYLRIGSNTKIYTSVVVLQLVQEGLLELDDTLEEHLPGLVTGTGIDAAAITIRQLLQHTSGLPNYTQAIASDLLSLQHQYLSPRDLIDRALIAPASFAPGAKWEYSNTNYILAGLIIERVTHRPLAEQITERIIDRLGLTESYFPGVGDQAIRGEHPSGYDVDAEGEFLDFTQVDPGWAWAAGQLITTPSDLNRFMIALLGGELLNERLLAEMQTTVPAEDLWVGAEYGLGLIKYPLSCGDVIWGHGGDIPGFETRNGVSEDGTAATIAVTALPSAVADEEEAMLAAALAVNTALDAAFCG